MKKITGYALCMLFLTGCAGERIAQDEAANARILKENEQRIHTLENSISALNTQVAQLNNRVYEVRTKNGQKTAMTVVPIVPGSQPAPQTPAAQTAPKATPVARKIDPKAKPSPLQAGSQKAAPAKAVAPKAPAPAPLPVSEPVTAQGGASGQLGGAADLALPPDEIPVPQNNTDIGNTMTAHASSVTIAPSQLNTESAEVPVPHMPASDLSLPPEHPGLPPMEQPAASAPAAQTQQTPPVQAVPRQAAKGEEAAYNAALKAARSGKTQEGIRLFRDFLQKYPNGKYAANADFWIGECLYSQGKYKDALDQFQVVNNTFPRHHKNADALLKAGMTLQKMGDQTGAQAKYRELLASFPNTDAAKRARAMGIR